MVSERPLPPFDAPEMFRWEAAPRLVGWRVIPEGTTKRCRRRTNGRVAADGSYRVCQRPAVAELDRGRTRPQWWAYCEDHMYGGWVEDGQVYRWRLAMGEGGQP